MHTYAGDIQFVQFRPAVSTFGQSAPRPGLSGHRRGWPQPLSLWHDSGSSGWRMAGIVHGWSDVRTLLNSRRACP